MRQQTRLSRFAAVLVGCVSLSAAAARAASPTAEQALGLAPVQKDVDFDRPTAEETKECTIKAEKEGEITGWVVRDPSGQILRRFVDVDGDNVVDLWCYYKDGLEVYRDVDANHNGKADQCRWLTTGGCRWGNDADENGQIDSWKQISAEEVSAELIAALATADAARFARLLLTTDEAKSLGLSDVTQKELIAKVSGAPEAFKKLTADKAAIKPDTKWVHFGATRPGTVPAGTDGSSKDLLVYENVVVVVETAGKHDQVQLGTLIHVGDVWRVIDVPRIVDDQAQAVADTGFFFQSAMPQAGELAENTSEGGPSARLQELLSELEKVDAATNSAASAADRAKAHARRADIIQQIAAEADSQEDRETWIKQLADMLAASAQLGEYPDAVKRLKELAEQMAKAESGGDLAAYATFRYLQADYGASIQAPNPDIAKIQAKWLADLEQYVKAYPKSEDAAEAMLQLGIAEEYAGQEDKAKAWYGQIAKAFPGTPNAEKATGAIRRLDSVGKVLPLKGTTPNGQAVDISKYKGRVVLIHYWATWSDLCKDEIDKLKELQAQYGKSGFSLIGVSLDSNPKDLTAFLEKNRVPWAQVYEPGGLDNSPLANQLGILTLPTMILVDQNGKVVNRSIHVSQVEGELKRLLR